jgi:hypothetical protein
MGTVQLAAASTVTNLTLTANTGFTNGDIVVIQTPLDVVFSAIVHSTNNATNVNFYAQVGTAVPAGSTIHRMSENTKVPIGAATVHQAADAIFAARLRHPIMLRLNCHATNTINTATVFYDPGPY